MKPYNQEKYERARKKVDAIKGFHKHVAVYIVINLFILLLRANVLSMLRPNRMDLEFERWLDWNTWGTAFLWGVALIIHGFYVYRANFGFIKRWEDRKIREIMEKEERSNTNNPAS